MDSVYNGQVQAISIPKNIDYRWSSLDLLILITLAMYVFSSVSPQPVGNCSQRVSVQSAVKTSV